VTILAAMLDPAALLGGGAGTTVLGFVAARFHKIEKEVRECRRRDARFVIIEGAFRMVVGEMRRNDPANEVLQRAGDLLNQAFGEQSPAPSDFKDLLGKIDEADKRLGEKQ
jgi:hypothetical protein